MTENIKLSKILLFSLIIFISKLSLANTTCYIIYDLNSESMQLQEGVCNQPLSPASTFKLALSLMGYDSKYLVDEHLPNLPFRPHYVNDIPK